MKKLILLSLLLVAEASAMIDLSKYTLTETQINLLYRFEEKGYSDEKLEEFASKFHSYNLRTSRDQYIPPHTPKLLDEITHWAKGGAFYSFVGYTSYTMDIEAYQNDCPDWAVFNFGKATGTQYLKRDILLGVINVNAHLQYLYAKDKDSFEEKFIEVAKSEGFFKYLKK